MERSKPSAALVLLPLVLLWMAFQNFTVYFDGRSQHDDCWWNSFAPQATAVGEKIAKEGDGYEYFLSSRYYGHLDIEFLGYAQKGHIHPLLFRKDPAFLPDPGNRGLYFALEEGQNGVLQTLELLYPGGEMGKLTDHQGRLLALTYRVPAPAAAMGLRSARAFWASSFGLTGIYRSSLDPKSPPALVQADPVINFTYRGDFPLRDFPPLSVHWSGTVTVPSTGAYRFLVLTNDSARLELDGKKVLEEGKPESADLRLGKGPHRLDLYFQKSSGTDTALTLAWRKPGDDKFEVVPATVLHHGRSGH